MSATEVSNEALQILGTKSTIATMDEDSNEARACLQAYETIRKRLIRAAPWGFCKAVAQLGLLKARPGTPENTDPATPTWLSSYPPPGWLYTYAKPSDCIRMRYVMEDGGAGYGAGPDTPIFSSPTMVYYGSGTPGPQRFAMGIDGTGSNQVAVVNCNARAAIGVYNADVTNDDLWEHDFREAFVHALAARICNAITGERGLMKDLIQVTNMRIVEASVADANELLTTYNTLSTNLQAREQMFNPSFADQWPVP